MKKITRIKFFSTVKDNFKTKFNHVYLQTLSKKINKASFKNIDLDKVKDHIKDNFIQIKPKLILQDIQEKVEKLSIKEDNLVLLKQSQFWAKAITWTLISGTFFAIGWISIAKTDEIVIATGKLEPDSGVIDVQMPIEGIASKIHIKEGDKVSKGQLLITLDTEITQARHKALNQTLDLNIIILEKLQNLLKEGAVSELQVIQHRTKIAELESQIISNEVNMKYQKIISPAEGLVFDLQPKGPGYVAKSSQPVLKIVPTSNLLAKVEINSRTIGFIKPGKEAEISIDSFPSSDFGVIDGVVISIGSDALDPIPSQGKGYRFPAKIKLNTQYLQVKSGQKLPLKPGMSMNANIKLRKVTYLQLLLNKFGDKTKSIQAI